MIEQILSLNKLCVTLCQKFLMEQFLQIFISFSLFIINQLMKKEEPTSENH